MEKIKKLVASNIKAARKAKGWTQTDLALASGVSFRGIQDIETGRRSPRPDTLSAICGALGVSEAHLYSGVSEAKARDSKSDLIAEFITLLPTLDENQLRGILPMLRAASQPTAKTIKAK